MADELKYKIVLQIDYGNFFSVAERLADEFAIVYYWTPYVFNGFPEHNAIDIGRNVSKVRRVKEWATVIGDVDMVLFSDAHEPAWQEDFKKRGKAVFGSGVSSELEHNKVRLMEILEMVGLPTGDYWIANGIDELEGLLKTTEDAYVKATLRGDNETWHHKTWALSKGEIIRMRKAMGIFDSQETYLVAKRIESIGEIGYDGFCVNGLYPERSLAGIEIKDIGYAGRIIAYKDLPRQLKILNDKLSAIFSQNEYRGAFSTEVLIAKDLQGYPIDLTCRFPEPPTSLAIEMYTNFPKICWDVSRSMVPVIETKYEYGVELIIYSDIAETDPSPLIVPEEYQRYVKIKNLVIDEDGTWNYTPQNIKMKQIGACIGMGNTLKKAVEQATKVAESIKGFDTRVETDCLDKIYEQTERLTKAGIKFL